MNPSIKDLFINYPNSSSNKIVFALHKSFDILMESYWTIALICFGISIMVRLIESLRSDKDPLILGDIIVHAVVVMAGLTLWESYFLTVTNMFNIFADKIFSVSALTSFIDYLWTSVRGSLDFNIFKIQLNETFGALIGLISIVAVLGVFVTRKIMLAIMYIFGGLMIAISPLPIFGMSHIGKLISNHIQVSGWVVVHSGLLLVLSSFASSPNTGSIEFIIMSTMYITVSVTIPTMSRMIFGGDDFMAIPLSTNVTQAGVGRLLTTPMGKFGAMKNSILGFGVQNIMSKFRGSEARTGGMGYAGSASSSPGVGLPSAPSPGLSDSNPSGGIY